MYPSLEVFELALHAGEPSDELLHLIRENLLDMTLPLDDAGWDQLSRSEKRTKVEATLEILRGQKAGEFLN